MVSFNEVLWNAIARQIGYAEIILCNEATKLLLAAAKENDHDAIPCPRELP